MFWARLVVLFILTASPSWAVEIWRNQEKYNFKVELPGGQKFVKSGIDRKFQFDGVAGNLRLIQDDYENCADLVQERKTNRAKDGFSGIRSERVGNDDCTVVMVNDAARQMSSSFYVFMSKCQCFAALHFYYAFDQREQYLAKVQPIVDSLRANNKGKAAVARNEQSGKGSINGSQASYGPEESQAPSQTSPEEEKRRLNEELNSTNSEKTFVRATVKPRGKSEKIFDSCSAYWNKQQWWNRPNYKAIVGSKPDDDEATCYAVWNLVSQTVAVSKAMAKCKKKSTGKCFVFAAGNVIADWALAEEQRVLSGERAQAFYAAKQAKKNAKTAANSSDSGFDGWGLLSDVIGVAGAAAQGYAAASGSYSYPTYNSTSSGRSKSLKCPEGQYSFLPGYGKPAICVPYHDASTPNSATPRQSDITGTGN